MPQKTEVCPYCRSKRSMYRISHKVGYISKLSKIFQLSHQKIERLFSFNIIECKDCGLFYTDRMFTNSEANTYYNYKTYENVKFGAEHKIYYNSLINFISSFISLRNKKFVDIGCAYGYLLNLARNRGAIPIGFEIDKRIVDYAKKQFNLDIINEDFLEFKHPSQNCYDIIVVSAVLEHLYNPIEYLKKIYDLLKPGGILYLDTPETCVFSKYIMRESYFGYVIGHYTFPSRKLIIHKLNEIGFQILASKTPKLTFNRILNFIPKLLKSSNKNFSGFIERNLPDEFYMLRSKNLLNQLKNTPLIPFSLGYCRILCTK